MLVFSEYAAADTHEHPTFDKLYACFVQYIGRQRTRGNGSASKDILNLEQCRKDYDTMELKGSCRLVRKSTKTIIDSSLEEYSKDLLNEVIRGRKLSTNATSEESLSSLQAASEQEPWSGPSKTPQNGAPPLRTSSPPGFNEIDLEDENEDDEDHVALVQYDRLSVRSTSVHKVAALSHKPLTLKSDTSNTRGRPVLTPDRFTEEDATSSPSTPILSSKTTADVQKDLVSTGTGSRKRRTLRKKSTVGIYLPSWKRKRKQEQLTVEVAERPDLPFSVNNEREAHFSPNDESDEGEANFSLTDERAISLSADSLAPSFRTATSSAHKHKNDVSPVQGDVTAEEGVSEVLDGKNTRQEASDHREVSDLDDQSSEPGIGGIRGMRENGFMQSFFKHVDFFNSRSRLIDSTQRRFSNFQSKGSSTVLKQCSEIQGQKLTRSRLISFHSLFNNTQSSKNKHCQWRCGVHCVNNA